MTRPTQHNTPADTLLTNNSGGIDIWQFGSEFPGEIDLRSELDEILRDRGHYAFFRRALDQRAPGWQEGPREVKPDQDPFSWNGYMYQDEVVRVRVRPTYEEARGISQMIRNFSGFISSKTYVGWLSSTVVPSLRDGLIEVTLDSTTGAIRVPYNIERAFAIRGTHPYRDQKGRIEYWAVILEHLSTGK